MPVLRGEFHLADDLAALAKRRRLAEYGFHAFQRGAPEAQKLVANPMEMLAHDVETGFGQQMMDVGDASVQRILDRNDGKIG